MDEPLELRTHTSLWRVEKRLYKLYDFTLPVPVSLRQAGTAIAVGVPWFMLMKILGVHFGPPFGHLLWLAPPALLTWYASKPVAEGKRLMELLISQFTYIMQSRVFARLRPFKPNLVHEVSVRIWHSGKAPERPSRLPETQPIIKIGPGGQPAETSQPMPMR